MNQKGKIEMKRKAQTAIEYLLLVSSVILLVVIVFMLVKGNVFGEAGKKIFDVANSIFGALKF